MTNAFLHLLFKLVSRVFVFAFFAASVNEGKIFIWFVLLIHCLVMAIFFRSQKDQQDSDSSTKVSTTHSQERDTHSSSLR